MSVIELTERGDRAKGKNGKEARACVARREEAGREPIRTASTGRAVCRRITACDFSDCGSKHSNDVRAVTRVLPDHPCAGGKAIGGVDRQSPSPSEELGDGCVESADRCDRCVHIAEQHDVIAVVQGSEIVFVDVDGR